MSKEMRVGIGYDAHQFEDGRKLILGGVEFPEETGLAGHSDADVVAHAVIDALLGAAGLSDIGQQFPDTDDKYENADSIDLMRETLLLIATGGWHVGNVDITVVAEKPNLVDAKDDMEDNMSKALGVIHAHVNVKATTNEGMGFIGRGEGIAAMAVATIER